jgi:hypothetical protein
MVVSSITKELETNHLRSFFLHQPITFISSMKALMPISQEPRIRLLAALAAGTAAVTMNMIALESANLIPLTTAKGGILKFGILCVSGASHLLRFASFSRLIAEVSGNVPQFEIPFHILMGLMMALGYAFFVEPHFNVRPFLKGWLYGLGVWLLNAALVLPSLGEGFAGIFDLSALGIIWFAASHFLYFAVLAWSFEAIVRRSGPASPAC